MERLEIPPSWIKEKNLDNYFCEKCIFSDMTNFGIPKNSFLLSKKVNKLVSGDIGIFMLNDNYIARSYQKNSKEEIYLQSNDELTKINDYDDFKIIGRVERVVFDL